MPILPSRAAHSSAKNANPQSANESDVVALVRWAAQEKLALIPRGSGSSMAGGAIGNGVIVDLSRLSVIQSVNAADRSLWVGPGAVCADVDRAAHAMGLRFPVDPSSARF